MEVQVFRQHVDGIQRATLAAIETYFAENRLPFNLKAYQEQTSIDGEQAIKELLFYGAEVFPETPTALS